MGKKRKGPKRSGGTSQQGLNNSQNPCLEPKHKVFLSHSGAQKNFTAQLCEDLIRVNHFPFFDKRLDSLPKGEEFPPLIFKAARQCWVAILVLSEEFFTLSKWPMIELNEFVQAQAADNLGLKLLPLYFGLTLKQLKDAGNQKRWRATWKRWAKEDGRIDVGKWVQALSKVLGPINGMEYDVVDEVRFRKSVVESVCKLISPDVEYDVSHVQARGQFCKAIQHKLEEEVEPYGVSRHRVMGLFGMPGMGKTSISKAMCNENFGEFVGKVCHVEFHGNNHVELRKKVLREMTGLKQEYLPDEGDKLINLLKSRMGRQKVFLIFDNVLSQEDINEARMYLDIGYLDSSRLLVTSRSLDVLKSVGVRGSDCMEMPKLEEHDAKNAFLHYARCRHLRAIRRKGLLEHSEKDCLAFKIHDLYVEFARVEAQAGSYEGRRILYEVNGADIPQVLLRRPASGLWASMERLGLYKSHVKSLTNGTLDCFPNVKILQLYDCHELMEVDVGGMERLMSLDIVGCERLLDKFLGVWMLENLVWFRWRDIDEDLEPLSLDFSGLTSIQVLHLSCVLWRHKSVDPPNLNGCTELRELTMSGFHSLESFPDLSKLLKLEKVYFRYGRDAKSVFGLSSLRKLKILSLYWCPEVTELPGLGVLVALETLELVDVGLFKIYGLAKLRHLRILIVSNCKSLSSLGGLECVISLRVLDASGCIELKEIPNTNDLRELEVVNLSYSGVRILPFDFNRLAEHGILKIEGCVGLFDPLVVWLFNQEQHQPLESMVEHDIHCSWSNSLEIVSENSTLVVPTSGHSLANPNFFGEEIRFFFEGRAPGANSMSTTGRTIRRLAVMELWNYDEIGVIPGPTLYKYDEISYIPASLCNSYQIGDVVSALCNYDVLGILSLVVAKHVVGGHCWDVLTEGKTIRPLCESIIRFLEGVHNELEAEMKVKGRVEEYLMLLVQYILKHLTENEKMALALGALGIGKVIRHCIDKSYLLDSSQCREKFLDILALCESHGQKMQNINFQISTNLLGWNIEQAERTCWRFLIAGGQVVGLFGLAGMGKSTFSKVISKAYCAEFGGIVCHLEFNGTKHWELRRKSLQELQGFHQTNLLSDHEINRHLTNYLKKQKVFLCLDNVQSVEDIRAAKMYLTKHYCDGTKLLVTSRSLDVLTESLKLKEIDCMEIPKLEEKDATNVFLHYARCTHKSFNETELNFIKRLVEVCMFTRSELGDINCGSREHEYLLLALKVWGIHLGDIGDDPLSWDKELKTLDKHKLNPSNDPKHLLFYVLRQNYDKLDQRDQHIFLDLALFFPWSSLVNFTDYNIVEWFCIIHECSEEDIEHSLEAMRRKGLLENSEKDVLGFKIHDLYLEFARIEAQSVPFDKRHIYQKKYNWDTFSSEEKSICGSNLKVLQLYECRELKEFDVEDMNNLISLDVIGCQMLGENFQGIEKLNMLAWFRWEDNADLSADGLRHLFGLSSLQVIRLEFCCTQSNVPDLSKCIELRELTIVVKTFHGLRRIPEFNNLLKLERVCFRSAPYVDIIFDLSSLTKLKVLSLYRCQQVTELPGLGGLTTLETLKLVRVGLSKIHGLAKLVRLHTLIVSKCENLLSLGGLEYLTSLQVVDASWCEKLREVPNCSNLAELEVVNLSHSGIRFLPKAFKRLAKHDILKIEGCDGLIYGN